MTRSAGTPKSQDSSTSLLTAPLRLLYIPGKLIASVTANNMKGLPWL